MKKDTGVVEVGWDEAVVRVSSEFKSFRKGEIAVLGSAFDTNEDNYALQRFAREVLQTRNLDFKRHEAPGQEDRLLISSDRTPNTRGAVEVGLHPGEHGANVEAIVRGIREGSIKSLLLVDDNLAADAAIAQILSRLEFLVVLASVENETTRLADIVLPTSTYAEKNGTFTNLQGRVQRIRPSVATLDQDRALDGFAMSRLDKLGSQFDRWAKGAKRDARPTWRIIAGIALLMGGRFKYQTAEDVFADIASHVDAFSGMSYRRIGNKGMLLKSGKEMRVHQPA
jgi:predicted molibdopterin-dependent oxidoreductase YjgC